MSMTHTPGEGDLAGSGGCEPWVLAAVRCQPNGYWTGSLCVNPPPWRGAGPPFDSSMQELISAMIMRTARILPHGASHGLAFPLLD